MIRIAIYGKGGIGKSTVCSNLSAALTEMGMKVMQIGCDPKADSTMNLLGGERIQTVLDLVRTKGNALTLEDMVHVGAHGVLCVEAGGPLPGSGCAGRGIINALEKLEQMGAYETYQPDVILYDVLGDVVCGGFTMPMREGYADKVYIVTSGENMSVYAAANIAMALKRFNNRGYAKLGGFIVNERGVKDESTRTRQLAEDFDSTITAVIPRSSLVTDAEDLHQTVLAAFPDTALAACYRTLANELLRDGVTVAQNK